MGASHKFLGDLQLPGSAMFGMTTDPVRAGVYLELAIVPQNLLFANLSEYS